MSHSTDIIGTFNISIFFYALAIVIFMLETKPIYMSNDDNFDDKCNDDFDYKRIIIQRMVLMTLQIAAFICLSARSNLTQHRFNMHTARGGKHFPMTKPILVQLSNTTRNLK